MEIKVDTANNAILDVSRLIEDIRKSTNDIPFNLSAEVQNNINEIQDICYKKYYKQTFYGAAALNRQILLDDNIANLLTVDTIHALFQLPENKFPIERDSSKSNLASVLYWGFKEGVDVICFLPNNEMKYGLEKYEQQQNKFYQNTIKIITAIMEVAQKYNLDPADYIIDTSQRSLNERFIICSDIIKKLKKEGMGDKLDHVPSYSANAIRGQCIDGLSILCKAANIQHRFNSHWFALNTITITDPNITTMEEFVNHFISNPETLLNGWVSHLFYDRAHLEACLEQNNTILIGNNLYTVSHLIKEMVKQAEEKNDENIDKYPIVKQQLSIRFKLVEMDLKQRFKNEYNDYLTNGPKQMTEGESNVAEKIKQLLSSDLFKEIVSKHAGLMILSIYNEDDYFAKFLEICDSKAGEYFYGWIRSSDIQNLYQLGIKYSSEPTEANLLELDQYVDKLLGVQGKIAPNPQPTFFPSSSGEKSSQNETVNEHGIEPKK